MAAADLQRQIARGLLHAWRPSRWLRDVVGITPDPWQVKLLDPHLGPPETRHLREDAVAAGRQTGKSATASWIAAHTLIYRPNSTVVCAAPAMRQASELVRRVRDVLHAAGEKLTVSNTFGLELNNRSRLLAVPGGEDAVGARGLTVACLIIDEAAFVSDQTLAALRPMTATVRDSRIISISSVGPSTGWFWSLWMNRDPAVRYHSITVDEVSRIDRAFLERERRALGEVRFRQEFHNEWGALGSGFFGQEWFAMFDRHRGSPIDPQAAMNEDPDARAERVAREGARVAMAGIGRR